MQLSTQFQTPPYHSKLRNWSEDEDQRVKDAISEYEIRHSKSFPLDPFSGRTPFASIKTDSLSDLDRSAKQIRERWVTHLCPKLKHPSILKEDHNLILNLNEKYPRQWALIAKEIYNKHFNKMHYYSDNAIKNFCNKSKNKKRDRYESSGESSDHLSEKSVSDSHDEPIKKRVKIHNMAQPSIERQATFSDPSTISVYYPSEQVNNSDFCYSFLNGDLLTIDQLAEMISSEELEELLKIN